jgi:DNA polymerase III delta prime subunit
MEKEPSCLLENQAEFKKVCASVRSGYSLLVLGEAGTGINDFAHALYEELLGEFSTAIAIYKGSLKNFFMAIAFQLDIPTENENGKQYDG